MAERQTHWNNRELYEQRYKALRNEMFPGAEKTPDWDFGRHIINKMYADRAWLGCTCRNCELRRGHSPTACDRRILDWDAIARPLVEEYRFGPPIEDSPELWEEWPEEES